MNLFILHYNPRQCAQWHTDKHLGKMQLEALQMIATRCNSLREFAPPRTVDGAPYRSTHPNHPATQWVAGDMRNLLWTIRLALQLGREYYHRFTKVHACEVSLNQWIIDNLGAESLKRFYEPPASSTFPVQWSVTTNDRWNGEPDPIVAYRNYYTENKIGPTSYARAPDRRPDWALQEIAA